jgi:hypothetical protein
MHRKVSHQCILAYQGLMSDDNDEADQTGTSFLIFGESSFFFAGDGLLLLAAYQHISINSILCQNFKTDLRFPFSQNRIRRSNSRRICTILLQFRIATSMVHFGSNLNGIHPHPILHIIIPRRNESLLAYGAWKASQNTITRHRNKFVFGVILDCSCSR